MGRNPRAGQVRVAFDAGDFLSAAWHVHGCHVDAGFDCTDRSAHGGRGRCRPDLVRYFHCGDV